MSSNFIQLFYKEQLKSLPYFSACFYSILRQKTFAVIDRDLRSSQLMEVGQILIDELMHLPNEH